MSVTDHILSVLNSYRDEGRLRALALQHAQQQPEPRRLPEGPPPVSTRGTATAGAGASEYNARPLPEVRPARRLPEVRTSKGLPAPGEEEANDANFNVWLSRYPQMEASADGRPSVSTVAPEGVTFGNSRADMQPSAGEAQRLRVARPVEFLEKRVVDDMLAPKATDNNGGLRSALIGAGRNFARGVAATGSIGGGIGAAGVGAVRYGLNRSLDEQDAQGELLAKDTARLGAARENQMGRLKVQDFQAGVRFKEANADYLEGKPQLERDKLAQKDAAAAAKQKKDAQGAVLAKLRLFKGQKLDSENPRHMRLLQEAEANGIYPDVQSWNDASSNWGIVRTLDPRDETKIIVQRVNKLTGETRIVTGEDDMPVTVGGTEKRDEKGVTETGRDRMVQGSARLRESMLNGLSSRSARTFKTETDGLFTQRAAVEREINSIRTRKAEMKLRPAEADRLMAELEAKRDGLTQTIEGARQRATGAPSAPSSGSKGRVSRGNFNKLREDNPSLRGKSDAEVEAALKSMGVEVY